MPEQPEKWINPIQFEWFGALALFAIQKWFQE